MMMGMTRRKLLWSLGLATSLFAVSRSSSLWSSRSARRPPDSEVTTARALLVLACNALEAGELHEARDVIVRLRALAPEQPEPWILEKLLVHRQRENPEGWGQVFLDAWIQKGRPDLQRSVLLPEVGFAGIEELELESAWRRATSSRARISMALLFPKASEARIRQVLQMLPELDEPALLVAAFDLLTDKRLAASLRQEAALVLRQQLSRLAEASPGTMRFRLLQLLAGTEGDVPLGPRELDALEALSVLPTWKDDSFTRQFLETRRCLEELALSGASGAAFTVAERALGHRAVLHLLRRVETTREHLSEDVLRRMGRMLWRIGGHLSEQSSLLECTVGALLMAAGATHLRHGRNQREAFAREDALHQAVITSLRAALDRWPLRSLTEHLLESRARSEVTWLRAFVGKSTFP